MPEPLNKQSYSLVDFFEEDDYSESETYNEYTKLTRMNVARISHRVEQIKSDPAMLAMMARSWKSYPGSTVTPLPPFRATTSTWSRCRRVCESPGLGSNNRRFSTERSSSTPIA